MPIATVHSELSTLPNHPKQSVSGNFKITASCLIASCLIAAAVALPAAAQTAGTYAVTNLVSDGSVPATIMDPGFINPWGVTNSTFWVSTQATGFSYVISPTNFPPFTPPATPAIAFKITIPAGGTTPPTGQPAGAVSIGAANGFVLPNGTKASFLFGSLDGLITGWNSKLGTAGAVAQIVINSSPASAEYTGLALATNANGTFLLAANFGKGSDIEVFDNTFAPAKLAGTFTDTALPAGYVPFSVHTIGTQVFVAYALRSATTGGPTFAPGNGLVNIFDTSGNFVAHAVTLGSDVNAPWGVAVAPATFGVFGGDILVGNLGDGIINAFDPKTFAYVGQLADGTGKPIVNTSLWEIFFGLTAPSATNGGNLNTLYLTAGLTGEQHGLLASINSNPTATGTPTFGFSASTTVVTVADGSSTPLILSAVPTNNFSGSVTLACSGLPDAATCTFAPATLAVTAAAPASTTVTIATVKKVVLLRRRTLPRAATGIVSALLLPFGAILAFFRRRSPNKHHTIQLLGLLGVLLVSACWIEGCSSSSAVFVPSTPTGTSVVTIKATSGTITQSAVVNLTVQ